VIVCTIPKNIHVECSVVFLANVLIMINNYGIEALHEGQVFEFREHISDTSIDTFVSLTGDASPLHINSHFARSRGFKNRAAHGFLLCGYLSRLVGMHLPGENALLISANVKFSAPVYPDDEIIVSAIIDQISTAMKCIVLGATITNAKTGGILLKAKLQIGFTEPKLADNEYY
jgi:3-hydroxybutyryl-CoA dehydratase